MKKDLTKIAMLGLLAGVCLSANSSAGGKEVAMSKCSKDNSVNSSCNNKSNCNNKSSCNNKSGCDNDSGCNGDSGCNNKSVPNKDGSSCNNKSGCDNTSCSDCKDGSDVSEASSLMKAKRKAAAEKVEQEE